jgi:quinol-cytochrome oxidoreductase complex cytochrome b subunit
MAEIEIKKKSKPVWPWIVGILVVLAIVAWLIFRNNNTNQRTNEMSQLKIMAASTLVLRKAPVFPEHVPIKLETYLA